LNLGRQSPQYYVLGIGLGKPGIFEKLKGTYLATIFVAN